jgi:type VI protein secretion system component Hcp
MNSWQRFKIRNFVFYQRIMNVAFSKHAVTQMESRSIPKELAEKVIDNPDQKLLQGELMILQSKILINGTPYLLRVFINGHKIPPTVVTVYMTSKIEKYLKIKMTNNENQI